MKEGVGVWVTRFGSPGPAEFLLVRRATQPYEGQWFTVDGHLEPNETPREGALRELAEETSLVPSLLLADSSTPTRVDTVRGSVWLHGFVAFVAPGSRPILNEEHTSYGWYRPQAAHGLVPLASQRESLLRAVGRLEERSPEGILEAAGAAGIDHPGGSLHDHLERTHALLAGFGARPALRAAGLLHAAYGTDGFARALLPRTDRWLLRGMVGDEAEGLVYLYGACDRAFSYASLLDGRMQYRDRFTRTERLLEAREARDLMELTFANELDLARHDDRSRASHADSLVPLFRASRDRVSESAYACFLETFPEAGR